MIFVFHSKSMKSTSVSNTVFGHDTRQRPGEIYTEDLAAGPYFPRPAFTVTQARRIPMYREKNGKPFCLEHASKMALRVHEVLESSLTAGFIQSVSVRGIMLAADFLSELLNAAHGRRPNAGDIHALRSLKPNAQRHRRHCYRPGMKASAEKNQ